MTLLEVISLTYAYYMRGQALQDAVLKMYAEDLADLPADKCIDAYHKWRRNPTNKTFPLPAQIREMVAPGEHVSIEAQAREIAARICAAVPKFGWCNSRHAQMFIGPEGWSIVQRQGGWQHLCDNLGRYINPTTFQAQVRDQIEGSLRYGRGAVEQSIGALPESQARGGDLVPIGEAMRRLLNPPDDSPEGA